MWLFWPLRALDGNGKAQLDIDACDGQDCSSLDWQIRTCHNESKTIMLSLEDADGSYE